MHWFLLALGSAYFMATEGVLSKVLMQKNDRWTAGWLQCALSAVFLALLLWDGAPIAFNRELALLMIILMPLETLAYWLFLTAIQIAPMSLTFPFLSFTPVFTILTARLFLGETVSLQGAGGIVMVSVGAYILQANLIRESIFAPIRAVFTNPGSRAMLAVAFLYSITSTLGKKGVLLMGPRHFAMVYVGLFAVVVTIFQVARMMSGRSKIHIKGKYGLLAVASGLAMAVMMITHCMAIEIAPVPYMMSVKRTSMIFAILYGWIFFKEELIGYRLIGALVMMTGVFLIYSV